MRSTLAKQLERDVAPLCEVHGVELVALEWFQGAGRGLLRVTIDRAGGDPRIQDPTRGVGVDELTHVTRDVSAMLDQLETQEALEIDIPYQLEVTSPGPERPLQKRADYDRFVSLKARLDMAPRYDGPSALRGVLDGTRDGEGGSFVIQLRVGGKLVEVPIEQVSRGRLEEIVLPKSSKPGKPGASASSKRQERLKDREKSRELNAEHLRRKSAEGAVRADERAASVEGGVEHADGNSKPSGAQR